MPKVIISGEKKGIGCSRASCDPEIVLAHMPCALGVLAGVEINAHIGIDHQRMIDVNHHQTLERPRQGLVFGFPLSLGSSNRLQCLDQLRIAFITGPGVYEGRHTSLLVVGQAAKNRLPTGWKWSVCKRSSWGSAR